MAVRQRVKYRARYCTAVPEQLIEVIIIEVIKIEVIKAEVIKIDVINIEVIKLMSSSNLMSLKLKRGACYI